MENKDIEKVSLKLEKSAVRKILFEQLERIETIEQILKEWNIKEYTQRCS